MPYFSERMKTWQAANEVDWKSDAVKKLIPQSDTLEKFFSEMWFLTWF